MATRSFFQSFVTFFSSNTKIIIPETSFEELWTKIKEQPEICCPVHDEFVQANNSGIVKPVNEYVDKV